MNVVQLQVILHHFYDPRPYPHDSPAVHQAHAVLEQEGLIEETLRSRVTNEGERGPVVEGRTYNVTERGRTFVNALKSMPLPVQAWTMPKPSK